MRMGYVFGDVKYVDFEEGATFVTIPKDTRATLVLRLIYSGKLIVNVGMGASLIFSIVNESVERSEQVDFEVSLDENATYVQTFNVRECKGPFNLYSESVVGPRANYVDNLIVSGGSNVFIDRRILLNEKSRSNSNMLLMSENGEVHSEVNVYHNGNSSSSSVFCVGSLREGSNVKFTGRATVPNGLKDVESFIRGKFLVFPGAYVSTLPILNIHSKDVKTGHGISVTNIDERWIAYLQSKGISREDAISLIEKGLVEHMLNRMGESISSVEGGIFEKRVC